MRCDVVKRKGYALAFSRQTTTKALSDAFGFVAKAYKALKRRVALTFLNPEP